MSFISPQMFSSQINSSGDCCPNTFIGFCLTDGTPIAIIFQGGSQTGWINIPSGVFTPGAPPAGTTICGGASGNLSCLTDSVAICSNYEQAEDSAHVSGEVGAFVLAVRNDSGLALAADGDYIPFSTDATGALRVAASVNVAINYEYPEDSLHVSGDVGAFVLGVRNDTGAVTTSADGDYSVLATDSAGRIGIADLGGSVTVDAVDLDIRNLVFATDKVDVSGSTVTVNEPVTVDAVDLDIRNLVFATDKVDVSGSTVTVNEPVTVDATDLDIRNLVFATDKVDVSGSTVTVNEPVTVDATDLDIRNLVFATDKVDVSGSAVTVNEPVTVDAVDLDIRNLDPVTDSVGVTFDYAEDSPHVSGDVGAFVLGVRNDAGAVTTSADGDLSQFSTDSAGRIGIADLGGSVTVDATDLDIRNLTFATDKVDVSGSTVTVNEPVTVDAIDLDIRNLSSAQDSVGVTFDYAEDSAHVSGDVGAFVLAVRNDAHTVSAADGDYTPFITDSLGSLRVSERSVKTTSIIPSVRTTVGVAAVSLAASNSVRRRFFIQNVGTTIIYIGLGATAPTTSVFYAALPGGSAANDGTGGTYLDELWGGQVQAISSAASGAVVFTEVN